MGYQTLTDLGQDIASAIREKTGSQGAIPVQNFGDMIRELPAEAAPITGYNEAIIPNIIKSGTAYSFVTSAGEVFLSSNTANSGIWRLDKTTNTLTQVYATGDSWSAWFESNSGEVFVSSSSSSFLGILRWDGTTFVSVYSSNSSWIYWFESSTGDIFVTGTASSNGVLHWNGAAFTKVYATNSVSFAGTSTGDVFCSTQSAAGGVMKWDAENSAFVQVKTNLWYLFVSSKDEVFLSSSGSGNTGIHKWDDSTQTFVQVAGLAAGYTSWFESKNGDVFVYATSSAQSGIYWWNDTTFVAAYSSGYNWRDWFESSNGDLFVSSPVGSSSTKGILRWNGTTFIQVYSDGCHWTYWFESSAGDIFVSCDSAVGNVVLPGIFRWNGTTFVQSYPSFSYWAVYEENETIYAVSATYPAGILQYDASLGIFKMLAPLVGGAPFGGAFRLIPYTANAYWPFICKGTHVTSIAGTYSTTSQNGDMAISISDDKTTMLYTNSEN